MPSITALGAVLIPISLYIFYFASDYLVPWAVFVAAFQAASVVNISGGFPVGVSPYFFVATLLAVRFCLVWLGGRMGFGRDDMALGISRPLLMLALWGALSALVLPVLFRGINVDTPRLGMDPVSTTPLEWSMSNAAQAGYLLLNCALFIYCLWKSNQPRFARSVHFAFVGSGVVVFLVGVYQLGAHLLGFRFPSEIFNSNSGWQQLVSQQVAGAFRVSATFNEPSSAGTFFVAWTAYLLTLATNPQTSSRWIWAFFWCGVLMLVLTTSTTAYVSAIVLVAILSSRELFRLIIRGRLDQRLALSFVAIVAALAVAVIFIPDFRQLLTDILWRKNQTNSGQERASTIIVAINVTLKTFGLGVGLGSNRPSGMFFYIISNIGVPGCVLFASLLISTLRTIITANGQSLEESSRVRAYLRASTWAFAMFFLAMLISGGDISSPHLWILWSMVAIFGRNAIETTRFVARSNAHTTLGNNTPVEAPILVLLTPDLRV